MLQMTKIAFVIVTLLSSFSFSTEFDSELALQLEATYSPNMMSAGGLDFIDLLFDTIDPSNLNILEIGSGLGGAAFYIAEKFQAKVTGLEVTPWLTQQSQTRTPQNLRESISFLYQENGKPLPFADNAFDLLFSKEVFTHIQSKKEYFEEYYRVLKDQGIFIFTDWISSTSSEWGENMRTFLNTQNVEMYPQTEIEYLTLLENAGFTVQSVRDDTCVYINYYQNILSRLEDPNNLENLLSVFNKEDLKNTVAGYHSILNALITKELLILHYTSQKN